MKNPQYAQYLKTKADYIVITRIRSPYLQVQSDPLTPYDPTQVDVGPLFNERFDVHPHVSTWNLRGNCVMALVTHEVLVGVTMPTDLVDNKSEPWLDWFMNNIHHHPAQPLQDPQAAVHVFLPTSVSGVIANANHREQAEKIIDRLWENLRDCMAGRLCLWPYIYTPRDTLVNTRIMFEYREDQRPVITGYNRFQNGTFFTVDYNECLDLRGQDTDM